MRTSQLKSTDYAPYYANYVSLLNDGDLVEELEISVHDFIRFVQDIPMDKHDYRYAPGKWTIKDIIQHLIDTERIFAYRALCFSRNDQTQLPGFDESSYAENTNANARHLKDMLTEMALVRQSTIALYKTFSEELLERKGIASENAITVGALGFMIIGHQKHHEKIFRERYLTEEYVHEA
ncbi:DinB family protein [Flavobacterium kingsejongi]|uniref:Damage-inducible protein DinB n=1 Tax=Flavobacterium kingsejongi TaxID=1678728 RepID=A0A2S1LTJ1_9FLAO|nr:DinB family protein [Flavobacterium kingsejongi]AWG26956.1 damage-inducible protein DinB [Flavobacterium kingsejongi]